MDRVKQEEHLSVDRMKNKREEKENKYKRLKANKMVVVDAPIMLGHVFVNENRNFSKSSSGKRYRDNDRNERIKRFYDSGTVIELTPERRYRPRR